MEETNLVYDLLSRWNTFHKYTDEKNNVAKQICKNDYKLNYLAQRYIKNKSNHTLATMIKRYYVVVPDGFDVSAEKYFSKERE